jgi:hypothetical protein
MKDLPEGRFAVRVVKERYGGAFHGRRAVEESTAFITSRVFYHTINTSSRKIDDR